MKKGCIVFAILIIFLQLGCTKSIRYTEAEIADFPPTTQDQIRKEQIALGMTKEQVRFAWGSPDSTRFLPSFEGKSREEWTYSTMRALNVVTSKILFFYDGRLIYIK
jgi:uncharacterized protein YneF (UPF0154 family)